MKTLLAILAIILTTVVFAPQAQAGDRRYRSYDDCDRQVYYGRPVYRQQPVYYRQPVYYDDSRYYGRRTYRNYDADCYRPRSSGSRFSVYFSR